MEYDELAKVHLGLGYSESNILDSVVGSNTKECYLLTNSLCSLPLSLTDCLNDFCGVER